MENGSSARCLNPAETFRLTKMGAVIGTTAFPPSEATGSGSPSVYYQQEQGQKRGLTSHCFAGTLVPLSSAHSRAFSAKCGMNIRVLLGYVNVSQQGNGRVLPVSKT